MPYGRALSRLVIAAAAAMLASGAASAQERARLSGLSDVNFGLVNSLADTSISQGVCAFTSSRTDRYSVLASGDAAGGAFLLEAGSSTLAYDVLWADTAGAAGGANLTAGTLTPGFSSPARQHFCNSGPPTTATLTIRLRDQVLQNARAGSYSGVLSITIAPE